MTNSALGEGSSTLLAHNMPMVTSIPGGGIPTIHGFTFQPASCRYDRHRGGVRLSQFESWCR
jgi:hypothetical protein